MKDESTKWLAKRAKATEDLQLKAFEGTTSN